LGAVITFGKFRAHFIRREVAKLFWAQLGGTALGRDFFCGMVMVAFAEAILFIFVVTSNNYYMENKIETYSEAVEKLRKIVAEIERGEQDVDVLLLKVKEATRLIKLCKTKLFEVDGEVKKILQELET
jgi:exodeoxyribonuclease VII small subunit